MSVYKSFGLIAILVSASIFVAGCSSEKPATDADGGTDQTSASVDDHSGWWCKAHGIPEEECSMCSAAYAKECREKGDWCEEHNRAASQCFKCDPSLAEKYTKLYVAKYGKQPPAATE